MNWDQVAGKWKQMKGNVRERWGRLTDDDLEQIAGKRDQLVGMVQERYGIAKEAAAKEVDEFMSTYDAESERKSRAAGRP
jgi:uncharacterized protein YjbJ (UPF0337 family)